MTVHAGWRKGSERGVSLLLVALGLTVLLGITGLAVDLATLYVARNEAQRAADAAALAGAQEFAGADVSEGLMTPSGAAGIAAENASAVGNRNLVIGESPNFSKGNFPTASAGSSSCPPPASVSGGCFNFSKPSDPRITVVVYKDMPTYFMGIFGIKSVPVSAVATAEAYVPEGSGPSASVSCAKPWLLPNCDPHRADPKDMGFPVNTNCPCISGDPCYDLAYSGNQYSYYFVCPKDATTCTPYSIVRPGLQPIGSIGERMQPKTGDPTQNAVASKFMPVFFPGDGTTTPTYSCPTCASNDQQNSTSNSAALYRENIECCSSVSITCGTNPIQPIAGNMVGPTGQGVDCLIHEGNNGSGQDCLSLDANNTCGTPVTLGLPFIMYAGSQNPYKAAGSQLITSDSLVTMPLYDGSVLCPGGSCPSTLTVDVQGYLSVFITYEKSGSVYGYVTGLTPCGGGGDQNGGVVIPSTAGNPVVLRLIH